MAEASGSTGVRGAGAGRRVGLRLAVALLMALVTVAVLRLLDHPVQGVAGTDAGLTDGFHGALLASPYSLRDATLTDSDGQPFRLRAELSAPVTLLFFGYTHCDDTCPAVLANITSALGRLPTKESGDVAMWFVTTDPARDDPATLHRYLDRFDPAFVGLTGPIDRLEAVASSVRVGIEAGRKLPSGGYQVAHGTQVLAVRPDATVPLLWTETTSAADLAADLDHLLASGRAGTGVG